MIRIKILEQVCPSLGNIRADRKRETIAENFDLVILVRVRVCFDKIQNSRARNCEVNRGQTRLKSVLVVDRENTAISKTPETILRQ